MSAHKLLKLYILDKRDFNLAPSNKAKLILVSQSQAVTKPDLTKPEGIITPDEALFFIPFCYMIVSVILIFMFPNVWKVRRAKIARFNCFNQVPCRNCRFFTDNHHLYCTVQPSIVLTKQALDCSDYHPK
jgi:hypothetical protein